MTCRSCLGVWVVMAIYVSPCVSQSFHPLGILPGADETFGDAITADGKQVFGRSGETHGLGTTTPVQWTSSGGLRPIGALQSGQRGTAWDVAADGTTVVGQMSTAAGMEAFRWTAIEGLVPLGDLPGGDVRSFAYGVSSNGQIVVGHATIATDHDTEVPQAFRWTPTDGMQGLGFLPDKTEQSFALDVSADGSIIVGFASRDEMQGEYEINYHEAFRWTNETGMIGLGDFPGGEVYSFANAINDDGTVIVGSSWGENGTEAFRWTQQNGMVGLGMMSSALGLTPYSDAYAVSADGTIIVGLSTGQAAVWDVRHGFRSIAGLLTASGVDLTGWYLEQARGISADGRTIVGYGINPSGLYEAWVAVLPDNVFVSPEPNSALMMAICFSIAICGATLRLPSPSPWR